MRYRTEVAALPSTCNIVAVQRFERGRLVFALSDRYRVIDLGMGKSPVLVLQATPWPLAKCGTFGALSARLCQPTYSRRLICTLCTRPTMIPVDIMCDPPYEINGSGRPLTGVRPSVMPMF